MPSYAADFEQVVTASAYPFEMELTVLTIDAGAPSGGKIIVAVNMLDFVAPGFLEQRARPESDARKHRQYLCADRTLLRCHRCPGRSL